MSYHVLVSVAVLYTVSGLSSILVIAQTLTSGTGAWELSRTPWGDPDLQGQWTNTTSTPMERPEDLSDQEILTEEDLAVRDSEVAARVSFDNVSPGNVGAYNEFWVERGSLIAQTSLVVDPPDGKLPAMTQQAQRKGDEFMARWFAPPASWEDMNLYDRCITRGLPGAMIPGFYNHNYLILQTPDYVALQIEMIHDTRVIPLDGRPHLQPDVRQWLGDSRGYWEGETLVVETTNFSDKAEQRSAIGPYFLTFSAGNHLRLVERFTRIDADTMDYRFTVVDPTVDTRPWTASIPMRQTGDPLFEYACHEGNYALGNILAGARADERKAAAQEGSK